MGNDRARRHAARRDGAVDPGWFRAFYEEALPVVYGYFYRRCGGCREVAADLTQETFVSAYRSLRNGTVVRSPLPWVVTIARRRLVDHLRRREKEPHQVSWGPVEVLVGPGWTSDAEVRLVEALDRLGNDHQLVLVLRYVDDLAVRDVAELMGRSVRATESLLVRARTALSECFEALSVRREE